MSAPASFAEAVSAVVDAARSVEFYTSHGSHGDGKLEAARTRLHAARTALRKYHSEAVAGARFAATPHAGGDQ